MGSGIMGKARKVSMTPLYEPAKGDWPIEHDTVKDKWSLWDGKESNLALGDPAKVTAMRLRGFAFRVDGEVRWAEDPPGLVQLFRWFELHYRADYHGAFTTDRAKGFAIHFARTRGADLVLAGFENPLVFSGLEPGMAELVPKWRLPAQQLPGPLPRSRSKPFANALLKRLWVATRNPLQDNEKKPGLYSMPEVVFAKLFPDESAPTLGEDSEVYSLPRK